VTMRRNLRHFTAWLLAFCLPLVGQQMTNGDAEMAAGNFLKARAIFTAAAVRLASTVGGEAQFHSMFIRQLEAEVLTGDYPVALLTAQGMLAKKVSRTPEEQAQVYLLQGRIALEQGDFDAAAGYFDRATAGGVAAVGLARAGIAETFRRQEKFTEATGKFAEAASMLGRDGHSATREVLLGPLEILVSLGKYAEARRAVEAIRRTWRMVPSHPDTIHLRNLAGYVAYRLGDVDQASKEVNGNAQLIEAAAGTMHPDFAGSVLLEAVISHGRRDERPAQAGFDRISKIVASLPDNAPSKSRLQLATGTYLLSRGDTVGAQRNLLEALKLRKAQAGENSLAFAEASVMVALLEIRANRHALAETYLKRAMTVFDSRQVSATQEYRLAADFAMGAILHQQKDFEGSKGLLTRWISTVKPAVELGTAQAREIVGGILLSQGQATESAKLLKEALDIEVVNRPGPAVLARISLLLGKARFVAGDLPGAVSMFEAVLGREESVKTLEPLDAAHAHRLLGDVYTRMHLPPNAANEYQTALKMFEGRLPAADPVFLSTMATAGKAMVEAKRSADAIPLLARLLALRDQSQDKYSPDSIAIVSSLADLYFESGRLVQASPLYERLIDATIKGKTIGDRKSLLERVGDTYARTGRRDEAALAYDQRARLALDRHAYAEAEAFAKKVQALPGALTASASQRASALNILGDIRAAQGKREEAEQFYREAVGLASGNSSIEASSLNGLGRLALKQKDLPGAKTQLDRALSLVKSGGSPASASRGLEAMVVANLAAWNAVKGDTAMSLELYAKFLQIEAGTTVDDPPLIEYLDEAANLYARTPGKSEEVEELYRRRLGASGRSFGDSSPETAYAHYNLAEHYALRKAYPKALDSYREAQRIFEGLKGPDSDEAVTVLTGIASTQAKSGDLDSAIATYGTLLAIAQSSAVDGVRKQAAILNALALVYRQANRHTVARETFQKVMALWTSAGAAEPAWIAAAKNAGVSYLDEGLIKEGSSSLTNLRAVVRKTAGNRDSSAEIDILRAMGQGLKRQNRNKEADDAIRQADLAEKRLGVRR